MNRILTLLFSLAALSAAAQVTEPVPTRAETGADACPATIAPIEAPFYMPQLGKPLFRDVDVRLEARADGALRTRQIQQAMRKLMEHKTCFVIAHRLSTIQNADEILVVNHGEIVEQGTHERLMERQGFYYQLYQAQFE